MYNYTTTIIGTNATEMLATIKFDAEGLDSVFKNTTVESFSEEGIKSAIDDLLPSVILIWDKMVSVDETLSSDALNANGVTFNAQYKPKVHEDMPIYDSNLEKIEENEVESDEAINVNYTVVPLTQEEKDAKLIIRRSTVRASLKIKRDTEISESINGFQVGRFEDRENLEGAINNFDAISVDGKITWVLEDNSVVEVTLEDLTNILTTYISRKALAFRTYTDTVTSLSTSDNPESYIVEDGV